MTVNQPSYSRSAFYWSLRRHMEAWPGFGGEKSPLWANWTEGIYPDYRNLAEETVRADSVGLHSYAGHILSSQAFAFNLFLPFREGQRESLSRHISDLVYEELTIDQIAFEWVPPGSLLCEIDGDRPGPGEPATAVDVVLWGWLPSGGRAAVLVEVKLTEDKFTHCNGRESPGNRRRDVCRSAQLFFDNPNSCYLRRPARKERDRRYWEIFTLSYGGLRDAFPNANLEGECPFAYDLQQPMRNLAIAQGMVQEDMVQKAWYVLCAHDSNPDITGHWQAWQQLLGEGTPAPFLPASEVVTAGEGEGLVEWAGYMRERYQL